MPNPFFEALVVAFSQVVRMYGFDEAVKMLKPEPTIDERLTKLAKTQEDLGDALKAVAELQQSATIAKKEATNLEHEVDRLRQDRAAAQELMKVPEEAVARVFARASARSRGRGLLAGIAIGLFTGCISSYLIWFLTKPTT